MFLKYAMFRYDAVDVKNRLQIHANIGHRSSTYKVHWTTKIAGLPASASYQKYKYTFIYANLYCVPTLIVLAARGTGGTMTGKHE